LSYSEHSASIGSNSLAMYAGYAPPIIPKTILLLLL